MVALQHGFIPMADDGRCAVESARADIERLSAGLSRALLASTPRSLRSLAACAADAANAAERRRARVGERPDLDPAADAAVTSAVDGWRVASEACVVAGATNQRHLVVGNAAGVGSLLAAGGMLAAGVQVMAAPVALLIVGAAVGPLAAAAVALHRHSIAVRDVAGARSRWAEALDAAGCPTMGSLHARRLAVAGWERRLAEAAAAEQAARPHLRAWQRVAGPGVAPTDVDMVVDRWQQVRAAQLRLLGLLLEARTHEAPTPTPPSTPEGWFSSALDRLRGHKLRFS